MIDCNNCPHLNITEVQQHRLWKTSGKRIMISHTCMKYDQRVFHYPYREPMIHPCQQCEEEKEKATIEYAYNKIKEFSNYELDPEYKKRLEEYHKKIEDDFQAEWLKKKFKWFFKRRRQQKLRSEITRRYSGPVFWIIEDILDDMLTTQCQYSEFFGQFVDVKDIAIGDKNYFVDECHQKVIEAGGCSLLKEDTK
jgi:hypothetical protein